MGFIVWFSLMMHIPRLVDFGVDPVKLFKQLCPVFSTCTRCSSQDCGVSEYLPCHPLLEDLQIS